MHQFPLFETIAIKNKQFLNLDYHQKRYEKAIRDYFGEEPKFDLAESLKLPLDIGNNLIRCKVEYNCDEYQVSFFDYTPRLLQRFQCVYTENLDYQFKYSNREPLDKLKSAHSDEVIIINNGFVSDCTIGNLLFAKQGKWYSSSHYLLRGTQLSKLVDKGKVDLIEIRAKDIFNYEQIMMVNALNPFDLKRAIPITSASILV
ncbi:branched-chain amino acid aminotransferase [Pasteurellaceae bacterium 15-036681]|nr:branched-chain amino acid aminotransferase [Pasteurellaceae bacterium 15-036681]